MLLLGTIELAGINWCARAIGAQVRLQFFLGKVLAHTSDGRKGYREDLSDALADPGWPATTLSVSITV